MSCSRIRTVYLMVILLWLSTRLEETDGLCTLKLNKDFGTPSPVLLRNRQYLTSNSANGLVQLTTNQRITVACPGKNKYVVLGNVTTTFEILEARCVTNTTFQVNSWRGSFKDIRCNSPPFFTSQSLNVNCHEGGILYRVGYLIKDVFYELYQVCFNKDSFKTIYAKHRLNANSRYNQPGTRPKFIEGDLFHKIKMKKVYALANQKSAMVTLLGSDMDKEYLTKNQFLTRGHLAARADFPLRAMQRASFHYVNTAPQWIRGNAGDWAALEEALRRRVQALNTSVIVYTGTEGVSTLQNRNKEDVPIYLLNDANNNGIVPVPLYFYKLVYDPKRKAASAFVTINSSYYNQTSLEQLTFCNDVCDDNLKFSWLTWRANDGTHSFCCNYEEFVQKVDYLPKLNVGHMFYYICVLFRITLGRMV